MKKLIATCCLFAAGALLLQASVRMDDSPVEARQKATRDHVDCLVLVYGKDWDRIGAVFRQKVWNQDSVQQAMGNKTVSSVLEVPQNLSKEENDIFEKDVRKKVGANVRSMPGIAFFDAKGFCYASLSGSDLPRESMRLAEKIRQTMELRAKRDALLAEASRKEGQEKARLLCMAGEIRGINRDPEILKELKKCDPEDKSGYVGRYTFNVFDLQPKLKDVSKEEGLKILDEALRIPRLTAEQKQKIYGLRGSFLRWQKASAAEQKENYKRMRDLDPNSFYGKAAVNASKAFAQ